MTLACVISMHSRQNILEYWLMNPNIPEDMASFITDTMPDWYERGDRFISARVLRSCSNLQSDPETESTGSNYPGYVSSSDNIG